MFLPASYSLECEHFLQQENERKRFLEIKLEKKSNEIPRAKFDRV
jgi:hypothetical protein